MKKYLPFATILLLCALVIAGCGENKHTETGTSTATESEQTADIRDELSLYDLRNAMCAADSSLPEMLYASSSDSDPDVLFMNISDEDYSEVDGFFVAYSADGKAYEIAVIRSKEEATAVKMTESLTRHTAERAKTYSYYMPDQVPKAEAAKIFTAGRYSVLIMCNDRDAVEKAFYDFIK